MKARSLLPLASLALLATLSPAARAELNPAHVPADAKWVVYADLGALRQTALGEQLIARIPVAENLPENSPIRPDIAKILETVGSITAFGDTLTPNSAEMNGALIIEGKAEMRTIAEALIAQFSVSHPEVCVELTGLGIEAHQIHGEIVIGLPAEPIVLVSRSADKMLEALELYRGRGASLAKGAHALTGLLPDRDVPYTIHAASIVPSEAIGGGENTPQARVLQMTQAAAVSLGEAEGNLVARATLESKDDALADKLVRILNGLTAMLSLAESSNADLTAFISSVQVKRVDRTVSLRMSYPTARLVTMFEEQMAQMAQHQSPSEDAPAAPEAPAQPKQRDVQGEAFPTWMADAKLGSDGVSGGNFALYTSDPVDLTVGDRITITSERDQGEHARVDFIELLPVGGGDGVRYEAEFMRLSNYSIERSEFASENELIKVGDGLGTAQLRFNGTPGSYRVRVSYVDETDGNATFNLSLVR